MVIGLTSVTRSVRHTTLHSLNPKLQLWLSLTGLPHGSDVLLPWHIWHRHDLVTAGHQRERGVQMQQRSFSCLVELPPFRWQLQLSHSWQFRFIRLDILDIPEIFVRFRHCSYPILSKTLPFTPLVFFSNQKSIHTKSLTAKADQLEFYDFPMRNLRVGGKRSLYIRGQLEVSALKRIPATPKIPELRVNFNIFDSSFCSQQDISSKAILKLITDQLKQDSGTHFLYLRAGTLAAWY